MIKARVIKSFYLKEDSELYLDEARFKELKDSGVVEKAGLEKDSRIEKAVVINNDEKRILSNQSLETN